MSLNTFGVKRNKETGIEYVVKINSKGEELMESPYMPAIPGNRQCPVISLQRYMAYVNENNNYLWQEPRFAKFGKRVTYYFGPSSIGHNKHEAFVSEMCQQAGFEDRKYSNHSLRATATAILSRAKLTYKEKMGFDEKILIGNTLNNALHEKAAILISSQELGPPAAKKLKPLQPKK